MLRRPPSRRLSHSAGPPRPGWAPSPADTARYRSRSRRTRCPSSGNCRRQILPPRQRPARGRAARRYRAFCFFHNLHCLFQSPAQALFPARCRERWGKRAKSCSNPARPAPAKAGHILCTPRQHLRPVRAPAPASAPAAPPAAPKRHPTSFPYPAFFSVYHIPRRAAMLCRSPCPPSAARAAAAPPAPAPHTPRRGTPGPRPQAQSRARPAPARQAAPRPAWPAPCSGAAPPKAWSPRRTAGSPTAPPKGFSLPGAPAPATLPPSPATAAFPLCKRHFALPRRTARTASAPPP